MKIGIIIIFAVIFIELIYVACSVLKINRITTHTSINQQKLEENLKNWCESYVEKKTYEQEDLFSPNKMKNGGTERIDGDIEITDYTQNTPWFIRK